MKPDPDRFCGQWPDGTGDPARSAPGLPAGRVAKESDQTMSKRKPPDSECHECGRELRGRECVRIGMDRLPRHKNRDGAWCWGSDQPVEIDLTSGY